jgi:hypothetical protein
MTDTPPAQQRSNLSRRWLIKMAICTTVSLGIGLACVYDAVIRYPARGIDAAEHLEYLFLQQLADDHREFQYKESVADPAAGERGSRARLEEFDKRGKDAKLSKSDELLREWLGQLRIVGKIEPASTSTAIPRTDFRRDENGNHVEVKDFGQRLGALRTTWTSGGARSVVPLSDNDLYTQWAIAAVGLGVGGWLLFLMASAKSRVYRWDPQEQRLTLPGGASLVPSDIAEFDKRKWHRLFINLKIKPSHPQLGGKDLELDLLRHEPVEDWVLAMERTAFPEDAEKTDDKPAEDAPAQTQPAP